MTIHIKLIIACGAMLWLSASAYSAIAQTGTYQKTDKTGATCTIAVHVTQNKVHASVFAWWNTPSGTHGVFEGTGILKDKTVKLSSPEKTSCHIGLICNPEKIDVTFSDCMIENLPEDFNGIYRKITDLTPGAYTVKRPKIFFYNRPDLRHPAKAYLVKGNRVTLELENFKPNGWAFVNYVNASGKTTSGYLHLAGLR